MPDLLAEHCGMDPGVRLVAGGASPGMFLDLVEHAVDCPHLPRQDRAVLELVGQARRVGGRTAASPARPAAAWVGLRCG
ncbi:MAG: hypothetical protein F4Z29_00520 [Gemmatimonadetes bacterium]|nr:hypothetical protein [Gemmatimonadota bacterium]